VVITNNISANITSNTIAITFSNTPANGTYAVLPGSLTGAYTATYSNLSSSQKATFSTVSPASVTVASKAIQSITGLASTASKTVGDPTYTLSVTPGDSTSPLTFSSDNTSVATVSSAGLVAIVGAGSTTIRVNQAADATYLAATEVTQTLTVARANPTGSTYTSVGYIAGTESEIAANGLSNLMNYALGQNGPSASFPAMPVLSTDSNAMTLTAKARTDDSSLKFYGQWTTDLSGITDRFEDHSQELTPPNLSYSQTIDPNVLSKFIRFKVLKQ
jgi:hypothetical protein